ncbi:MAG TPA: HEPN domain-containing protein [candidate division Zixibacteria bacterium]|nr:HEPN domain-containing protein [candidate division Zixibacteria bacterium]
MGFYADVWLRQARDGVAAEQSDFEKIAEAVEKAIKAALLENHGSIPKKHDHDKLVTLCQSTGVWDVLPPALKNLVQEVESYKLSAQQGSTAPVSAPQDLARYFSIARRLIDYMEYHVIGNDSVLKRLTVG